MGLKKMSDAELTAFLDGVRSHTLDQARRFREELPDGSASKRHTRALWEAWTDMLSRADMVWSGFLPITASPEDAVDNDGVPAFSVVQHADQDGAEAATVGMPADGRSLWFAGAVPLTMGLPSRNGMPVAMGAMAGVLSLGTGDVALLDSPDMMRRLGSGLWRQVRGTRQVPLEPLQCVAAHTSDGSPMTMALMDRQIDKQGGYAYPYGDEPTMLFAPELKTLPASIVTQMADRFTAPWSLRGHAAAGTLADGVTVYRIDGADEVPCGLD
ncbi:hypothetical protein [Bifidobacterium sp. ESL0764]|uniref:hypothetical protein n=1 Tax=Bifidobacterium sp. ESL0764 TaxID=2983228 RepID=UPI0023F9F458|nr:hypothetical protein [Bifidobacterium sp. ESL0764]WEV65616.1 hypothetical protein OZX71_07680 [Bifidobacterium sp. ESL0764]